MKNLKSIFFALCILTCTPLFCMQAPPQPAVASWDSLPLDVKKLIVPMIASSNVYEVTNTILALNHTNKFFRNFVRSESGILSILEHMPYTANAVSLIYNLRWKKRSDFFISVIWKPFITKWWRDAEDRLINGKKLLTAIGINDLREVRALLHNKNIKLNYNNIDEPNYGARYDWAQEIGYKKGSLQEHIYVYEEYLSAVGMAVSLNNSEMAQLLIKAGARPNMPEANGRSPLALAFANKDIETARLILAYGGDPKLPNWDDPTALMHAVLTKDKQIVQLLLDAGADPDAKNSKNQIAADLTKDQRILVLLKRASAKKKTKN